MELGRLRDLRYRPERRFCRIGVALTARPNQACFLFGFLALRGTRLTLDFGVLGVVGVLGMVSVVGVSFHPQCASH